MDDLRKPGAGGAGLKAAKAKDTVCLLLKSPFLSSKRVAQSVSVFDGRDLVGAVQQP
jgi:hypothetical protein